MFDIGFSEILVIAVVALVVIGPERLPKVARTLGHLFGRMQRYVNDVKSDIQREVELDELKRLQASVKDTAQEIESSVTKSVAEVESAVSKPLAEAEHTLNAFADPLAGSMPYDAPPAAPAPAVPVTAAAESGTPTGGDPAPAAAHAAQPGGGAPEPLPAPAPTAVAPAVRQA
jgi:sec-independent protein translocase protein TatB